MSEYEKDLGVIQALVERFEKQRLPRAVSIKERVDKGELLTELDISFLEQVFEDAQRIKPLVDKYPEWKELWEKGAHLYKSITEKALQNEQGG